MRESLGSTKPKGAVKVKVEFFSAEVRSWCWLCGNIHALGALPARLLHYYVGRSKSAHGETRKMVNYACVG